MKKTFYRTTMSIKIEKVEDGIIIESELLGVVGAGVNREDAIKDFIREFDYLYNRLQQLQNNKLTKKMQGKKELFKILIDSIE